jgi:hypothetical protein
MRVETIPIILGVIVALLGVALLADGQLPDGTIVSVERRRRPRVERNRAGETLIGLGTLCMAAALLGRDSWRYGTLAVIAGAVLLVAGAVMNRHLLHDMISFRGAARRTPEGSQAPAAAPPRTAPPSGKPGEPPADRLRIR